jgi:hypothetical protein
LNREQLFAEQEKKMKKIVNSSGRSEEIPEQPVRAVVPGLNGTVRLYHADRAVHPDREASGNLVFVHNTAAVIDAGGTVVLSRSGLDGSPEGMTSRLLSCSLYIVLRSALAADARDLTRSRYRPARG